MLVAAIRKAFASFRGYSDVPSTHGELPRAGDLFRCAGTSVHFSVNSLDLELMPDSYPVP